MTRVRRLFQHLRDGTLGHRLRKRYRWDKVKRSGGFVDFPIGAGSQIRLYTDSKLSEWIYWGDFERAERTFIERFLRAGDVFVDVGANIGLFTLEAARLVGEEGRVFSFEPAPKVFERLVENVALNGLRNVRLFSEALSDRNGAAELTVSLDGYDAWSSLGTPIDGQDFADVSVPVRTWTSFIDQEELLGKIDMAKIDVEGWEKRVLRGGRDGLLRPDAPVLQVEFTQKAALNAGSSCSELYDELQDLGYIICSYDESRNQLELDETRTDYAYKNLYAVKDVRYVSNRLAEKSNSDRSCV